jgi:3-hydroxy acid dehydrogenase / malonic semialdehyde reductase
MAAAGPTGAGARAPTELAGLTVLITGASSGIGRACATAFAAEGARLVLIARRSQRLEEVAAQLLADFGAEVRCIPLDVALRTEVEVQLSPQGLGPAWSQIDVLINAAGLARGVDTIQAADPDDWDAMLDTNVRGVLSVTRAVLPGMIERGRGHIVNLGSIAARDTYRGGAVYCATKAALDRITTGLRIDVLGTGVRVSTVDPGLVETEFSLVRFDGDSASADAVYAGLEPLTGADVAEVIRWVVAQPRTVLIADLLMMPIAQAGAHIVHREGHSEGRSG